MFSESKKKFVDLCCKKWKMEILERHCWKNNTMRIALVVKLTKQKSSKLMFHFEISWTYGWWFYAAVSYALKLIFTLLKNHDCSFNLVMITIAYWYISDVIVFVLYSSAYIISLSLPIFHGKFNNFNSS